MPRINGIRSLYRHTNEGFFLRLKVDLYAAHALTEFFTAPNAAGGGGEEEDKQSVGRDADACCWSLEADLHSSFLRFSLTMDDVGKIPRNHLRFARARSDLTINQHSSEEDSELTFATHLSLRRLHCSDLEGLLLLGEEVLHEEVVQVEFRVVSPPPPRSSGFNEVLSEAHLSGTAEKSSSLEASLLMGG